MGPFGKKKNLKKHFRLFCSKKSPKLHFGRSLKMKFFEKVISCFFYKQKLYSTVFRKKLKNEIFFQTGSKSQHFLLLLF